MSVLIGLCAVLATAVVSGLLADGSRARRGVALVVAGGLLVVPFCVPMETALARGIIGVGCIWTFFRAIELVKLRGMGAWRRVWHLLAIYDSRRARRVPVGLEVRALGRAVAYGLLSAAGIYVALEIAPGLFGPARWLLRWSGGLVAIYGLVDVMGAMIIVVNRLIGLSPPVVHRDPILSRSVQEFWSERWNLAVSAWLRAHCLKPLLRRGWPRLGLIWVFVVSGILHMYFTWAALGWQMAAWAGAFFVLQAPIVLLERALGVRRWPAGWGRVWAVGWLVLVSPLYVEPSLRLLR